MSETPPAEIPSANAFDWDALVPAEVAPVKVTNTAAPFDAMTLPVAIRTRIEAALVDFVKEAHDYVSRGNKAANLKYNWKVQAFPSLEMANKFVLWAKKYGKFRPDNSVIYPDGLPELPEGAELPSGQITVRLGKPGPYTPPGADKILHEIAVRYVAKPLERSDATNLPGSAAGQNGTPPAETPAEEKSEKK